METLQDYIAHNAGASLETGVKDIGGWPTAWERREWPRIIPLLLQSPQTSRYLTSLLVLLCETQVVRYCYIAPVLLTLRRSSPTPRRTGIDLGFSSVITISRMKRAVVSKVQTVSVSPPSPGAVGRKLDQMITDTRAHSCALHLFWDDMGGGGWAPGLYCHNPGAGTVGRILWWETTCWSTDKDENKQSMIAKLCDRTEWMATCLFS